MTCLPRLLQTFLILGVAVLPAFAQPAPPAPPSAPTAAPAAPVIAATVNGTPIPETAVQRSLEQRPAHKRAEARPELVNYLVDNVLVEQYLVQQGVQVEATEVDRSIAEMQTELAKQKRDLPTLLKEMKIGESELREQIAADLRWDKYATSHTSDKALKEFFDGNIVMFDSTTVRARHILLTPPTGDAAAAQKAQADLLQIRQQIEAKVNAELAKQTGSMDPLAIEKARITLLEDAFAEAARAQSTCLQSKPQGGDVGWFQRSGFMVEPFARTAFALKPFQMSDVVQTQFGYHLILVTDRKAGVEVKFEEVKDDVREVICDRLRETIVSQVRPRARIVITPIQ